MSEALIFDAVRTPRGKGKANGSLYTVRPVDLLATTLRSLQERNHFDSAEVDDVIAGCVTQTSEQGSCIARFAALTAGYERVTSGVTLNRFCASGLEACNQAAAMIAAGYEDLVLAGGVESMSRVPMGSDGGAIWDPQTQWEVGSVPQGISADLLATLRGFSRDDVDRFAVDSQNKCAAALERGSFKKSVVPVTDRNGLTVLDADEYPRPGTSMADLAKLKPAFEMIGRQFALDHLTKPVYPQVERIDHVHHAGNSSGIVDGAAAILVGNKEIGERLGLKPRARIRAMASIGSEPTIMLTGPAPSAKKALKKAGMTADDVDLYEMNEAFASVVLRFMDDMGISHDQTNVNGGAIAM
ncbi:MAG: acetyl-CoA C-acetyltransferase, partial [Myxococcales bacterium]|nr:acetyl-CoA C-acetyltransferase [Myxococcales bacterium]